VNAARRRKLSSFAAQIGWRTSILDSPGTLSADQLMRLEEVADLYSRKARWSIDAVGQMNYPENGEKWIAEYRTFIDQPKIWRLYARIDVCADRPNFCIARRSVDLTWDRMGYFDQWPLCWSSQANSAMSALVLMGTVPHNAISS
jgi:hypothetical protein